MAKKKQRKYSPPYSRKIAAADARNECELPDTVEPTTITIVDQDKTITIAAPVITLKLDLACGQRPKEGFEGVDYINMPGVKHVVNLFAFPWPFETDSVAEIHCSHFMEHVPMIEVDETGLEVPAGHGQDLLFRFWDEMYRILVPGGFATVVVPSGRSNRAFWDPTHRRFFMEEKFLFASKDWRVVQGLDHYKIKADFGIDVQRTVAQETNLLHPMAAQRHLVNYWNTIHDFVAKMQAKKPNPVSQ